MFLNSFSRAFGKQFHIDLNVSVCEQISRAFGKQFHTDLNVSSVCEQTDLADELDLFSLNVFDDHDLHLGKKVQRQITHCVSDTQTHTHTDTHNTLTASTRLK